ncbi:MAG: methyl-accepting chemotaxis protein [Pseudomonadota bacterium]
MSFLSSHLNNNYLNKKILQDAEISDKIMLYILAAHLPFIYFVIPAGFGTHLQGAIPATLLVIACFFSYHSAKGSFINRSLIAVSFMLMSAIMIMQQFGSFEMHFHIFCALAFLIIWRDWRIVSIAAGVIAVHHLVSVPLQLSGIKIGNIYYTVYAQNCDWTTFLKHAIFVVLETGVLSFFCVRMKTQFTLSNYIIANMRYSADQKDLSLNFDEKLVTNEDDRLFIIAVNSFYQMIRNSINEFRLVSSNLNNIVNTSSEIFNQNSNQLTSQSENIRSVAISIQKMVSNIAEVSASTNTAADLSQNTKNLMTESNQKIIHAVNQVNELMTQLKDVKKELDQLAQGTVTIGSTMEMIKSIADQTNLLALNAAIEAARAGEQGRGFAVVADEVRSLAQRSRDATNEINGVVENLQNASKKVVELMGISQQKSEDTIKAVFDTQILLNKTNESTNHISDLNSRVAVSIEQQHAVSENIKQNMEFINQANEGIQERAAESSKLSAEVLNMANNLQASANLIKTG